jgi:predicted XRE-type DNA-binding protein
MTKEEAVALGIVSKRAYPVLQMIDTSITRGNVFADLGFADAGERQTKTRLALAFNHIIKDQALKQADVARLLGVPQPKVSALVNYQLDGFSVEKLMEFIVALGRDVEIMVRHTRGTEAERLMVLGAA